MGGVKALTPGTGSNNGMGLGPRRKWDKWARWMVTSKCQTASGGQDSWTNQNEPCVTGADMEKIFIPDPPPLIKDRIPRGARNRSGAVDQSAFMTVVQMSVIFIINSGPPPVKGRTAGGGPESIVDR